MILQTIALADYATFFVSKGIIEETGVEPDVGDFWRPLFYQLNYSSFLGEDRIWT